MVSQGQLIKALEHNIEEVGAEWQTGSDDCFWWEADLRSRLLYSLWNHSMMWHEFEHGGKRRRVPLAHAEIPTRADTRKKYDLALFQPEIAEKVVGEDFRYGRDYGRRLAQNRDVLAVVEIKLIHYDFGKAAKGKIEGDIEKLQCPENQVAHRCLFIGCNTRIMDTPTRNFHGQHCDLRSNMDPIKDWVKNRCCDREIKVYFASDHPQDSPMKGGFWLT